MCASPMDDGILFYRRAAEAEHFRSKVAMLEKQTRELSWQVAMLAGSNPAGSCLVGMGVPVAGMPRVRSSSTLPVTTSAAAAAAARGEELSVAGRDFPPFRLLNGKCYVYMILTFIGISCRSSLRRS